MLASVGIRTRIAVLQVALVLAVLTMAGAAALLIVTGERDERRVLVADAEVRAAALLIGHVNRYSEQIAELLLLGDDELADFLDARTKLESGFAALEALVGAAGANGGKSLSIASARQVFVDIDRLVERVLTLRGDGRQIEAVKLFQKEIENRLDVDIDNQLQAFFDAEEKEAQAAVAAVIARRRMLATGAVTVSLTTLAMTVIAGWRLHQSLARPVALLAEAAAAMGRGERAGRVRPLVPGGGELAQLAEQFDAMAAQLEEQHAQQRRARDNLGDEVRARTAELREANQRLEAVDRRRVAFLADLSHELRTPLTVLRGEAEVTLRAGNLPDPAIHALQRVVRQAVQMERLVGDLLFLARSDADMVGFVLRPVVLQDVVAEAVEEGAILARREPEELLGDDWPEAAIRVAADHQRLKQAILIGIDNALKYGDADAPVQVSLTVDEAAADVVVRNFGMGLTNDELPRAFDRFFRGRNARGADGSGLGLSIARWIVERHRGTVTLSSRSQGLTEFRVRLPITA